MVAHEKQSEMRENWKAGLVFRKVFRAEFGTVRYSRDELGTFVGSCVRVYEGVVYESMSLEMLAAIYKKAILLSVVEIFGSFPSNFHFA
jgi:hypothetical protein